MTRKDYVKFAALLKQHYHPEQSNEFDAYSTGGNDAIRFLMDDLIILFREDNPNFDRASFLAACGVKS